MDQSDFYHWLTGIMGVWLKESISDLQPEHLESFELENSWVLLISEMNYEKYPNVSLFFFFFFFLLQKSIVFSLIIDGPIIKVIPRVGVR